MLVIRQRIDGGDLGKFREFFHVGLRIGADDRAVNHAAQHAGGVLDRLAAAQLNVIGVQKHHPGTQFADASLERDAGARGGLGKNQRPRLARERLCRMRAALAFDRGGVVQDFFKIRRRQLFQ